MFGIVLILLENVLTDNEQNLYYILENPPWQPQVYRTHEHSVPA